MTSSGAFGALKVVLATALFLALAIGAIAAVLLAWDTRGDDQAAPPPSGEVIPEDEVMFDGEAASDGTPLADAPDPIVELPDDEPWPMFGSGRGRTNLARQVGLIPPFDEVWSIEAGSSLRFPPVAAYGRLFVATAAGRILALDPVTGETLWEVDAERCTASSPAAAGKVVYVALMDPLPCGRHDRQAPGFVLALDAATGEELWRFEAGLVESSPLVANSQVYVGTWDNAVYAIDAESGEEAWSFETNARVRGGVAFRQNTIFVASTDNNVYALNARNGQLRWTAETQDGFRTTPSVSQGRVFVGNTDGSVYAIDAEAGTIVWTYPTGGPVLGTPAVAAETVYASSQDGTLYAIDADGGGLRWSFAAGSPLPASAMVMAGYVYISTQDGRTLGLDAESGSEIWSFDDGRRSSPITDGQQLYLAGANVLYALEAARASDEAEPDANGDPAPVTPEEPAPADSPDPTPLEADTGDDAVSELAPVEEPAAAEANDTNP